MNKEVKKLHVDFVALGRDHRRVVNRLCMMIPEIERYKVWKAMKCKNLSHYVAKYSGLSRQMVKKAMRVSVRVANRPILKEAIETLGINKIDIVTRLRGDDMELLQAAKSLSKNALEMLVREEKTGVVAVKLKIELDDDMQRMFNLVKKKFGANSNAQALKMMMLKVLKEEKSIPGNEFKIADVPVFEPKSKVFQKSKSLTYVSRYVPVDKRRQVDVRSQGICEYPGCNRAYDCLHHTEPWMNVHSHDGLVGLCNEHHEILHVKGTQLVDIKYRQKRSLSIL